MIAFVAYDTLLRSDVYDHSWDGTSNDSAEPSTSKHWLPVETLKANAEITQMIALELQKYFPKLLLESRKKEELNQVLDYAIKQMKFEMQKNRRITMRKLLDDFYLYLLWISVQDIIDNKTPSLASYRKHYPVEN